MSTTMNDRADAATDRDDPEPSGSDPDLPGQPVIEIDSDAAVRAVDVAWLEARVRDVVPHLSRPVARIGLALVDDTRMTDLHRVHHDDPTTTDVLTFDLTGGDAVDVDIAICVDEAQRQATERGHALEREVLLYAVHGLLHCTGYDDHTDDGYDAMHAEEDRLLEAIGVGATFGEAAS